MKNLNLFSEEDATLSCSFGIKYIQISKVNETLPEKLKAAGFDMTEPTPEQKRVAKFYEKYFKKGCDHELKRTKMTRNPQTDGTVLLAHMEVKNDYCPKCGVKL